MADPSDKPRKGDGVAVYVRSSYTKQSPPAHVDTSHWRLAVVERVKRDGTISDYRFMGAARALGGRMPSHARLLHISQDIVDIEALEADTIATVADVHWPDPYPNGADAENEAMAEIKAYVSTFKRS